MTVQEVTITPKRADEWLAKNMPQNRKIKVAVINKLVADILAGRWIKDGNSIKFNTSGFMIDGQHRLMAIVKSGKTVKTLVCYDVDSEAINTIDTGTARNIADVLSLNGIKGGTRMVGALARKILTFQKGGDIPRQGKRGTLSNQEILKYCLETDLTPFVNFGMACYQQAVTKELLGTGEWQFAYWMLAQSDDNAAQKFCTDLAKLRDKDAPAIRTLFESLTRTAVMGDFTTKMKLIITAWNAWRKGEDADLKLRKIQMAEIPELV